MTLTFITNLIHHHQIPLAEEFYKCLGDNYTFITTEDMPEFLVKGGYDAFSYKQYLLRANENEENYKMALQKALQSDIVIIGGTGNGLIKERLHQNKITFRYCERMFKKISYKLLSPRGWRNHYLNHTKFRNKNVYLLCAGAYVANDTSLLFAYPKKKFKWGYFTAVNDLDIDTIINNKPKESLKLLWTARYLDWKQPELAIYLAQYLKNTGYKFHLDMIGSGDLFDEIKALVTKLDVNDCVSLLGNMPNKEVREYMLKANIFLFTSNREEGWGAVLNEAMSSGCAVVASHKIGAVPYLIENEKNGLIFKSNDLESLKSQTIKLMNDVSLREEFGKNAYLKMRNEWSPKIAANNFLEVCNSLLKQSTIDIINGPCSQA